MKKYLGILTACSCIMATPFVLSSCGNQDKDPTDYVGNIDGTNWKGYDNGALFLSINDDGVSMTISHAVSGYTATDLIIPQEISANNATYKLTGINDVSGQIHISNSLVIPKTITSMATGAFKSGVGYSSLKSLEVMCEIISEKAFYQCEQLTTVKLLNTKTIGRNAFDGCKLLANLEMSKSVIDISTEAFSGCHLNEVKFDGNDALHKITMGSGALISTSSYFATTTKAVGGLAWGDITFPNGLVKIPTSCLYKCTSVTKVNIPEGVTTMESDSLYGCDGFDITWPDSLIHFGSASFCGGLSDTLILPNHSITTDSSAFLNKKSKVIFGGFSWQHYPGDNGSGPFWNNSTNLISIVLTSTTKLSVPTLFFEGTNFATNGYTDSCHVYVPSNLLNSYRTDQGWLDALWGGITDKSSVFQPIV